MMPVRDYRENLLERLRANPVLVAEYLNAALEDDIDTFLLAFRDVIDALGGGTRFSEQSGIRRESIYKMFKNGANPTLKTLKRALENANVRLKIVPKEDDRLTA